MELRNLQEYASDQLAESIRYNVTGFVEVSDVISEIESQEPEFDGDSYCPYYNQQVEVIARYESDFGSDAEDICGDEKYSAADWQKAQTAYAYAIAYIGYSQYFEAAKKELVEAIEEFETDVTRELETDSLDMDDVVKVQITADCPHGWAAHNRELEDGTMIWESGQLDGCNGMAKQVGGLWVSCCLSPKVEQ